MKNITLLGACLFFLSAFANGKDRQVTLENDHVKVVFDTRHGALIEITDKESGWDIMHREVLGQSFELLLPLEGPQMSETDHRYHVIKGVEQERPVIEKHEQGISFVWKGLKSDFIHEEIDITFRGEVSLTERGVEFSGSLVNNSSYTVEYVSWPCIGEVMVPDKAQTLYQNTRNDTKELFPHFSNRGAYWGIDYPTSTYIFPEKSFLQVNNRNQGFIFYHRTLPKHTLITSFELIPGFENRNTNPYEEEMDGQLVRIQFKANHVLYSRKGDVTLLDPLQFVTYRGDWAEGLNLYRNDCTAYTTKLHKFSNSWLDRPLMWRKISIKSGDELLQYAEESAALGVEVLLVSGWYKWKNACLMEVPELVRAIQKCQKKGMRVVLETNWTNVDRYTNGYKEKFRKYVMSDPFGMPYNYGYICPNAPAVHQWAKDTWLSLPALHMADGYMNNDHNHSGKTYLCFDTNHGHRLGEATINGMMSLDKEMLEALTKDNGKVAIGKGFIDFQNSMYDGYLIGVSDNFYVRHRYLDPQEPILARVEVKNARRGINKALLYRMNIVYDVYFYNNRLADYPNITTYGNQVNELRKRYQDRLWNATFDEHHGMDISGSNIEYSVFVNKEGKRTAVVCNMSNENVTQVTISYKGKGNLFYATPEVQESRPLNSSIELPSLSAVIIMEE